MQRVDAGGMNDFSLESDRTLLARIEDAGLNASAPPQQRWMDGWLLRYSKGKAKRARCVNALALGLTSVETKLAACAKVYADVGLPLMVRVTPFTLPSTLDGQLEALGFLRFDATRVMVLRTLRVIEGPAACGPCDIREIALEPFAQRVGALRGTPLAQRQAHAQRLANAPVPFTAFELREHDEVVACGQFALEGGLVGLYDLFTAPHARGRGLARYLCQHMLVRARQAGAAHGYLQVDADNAAARKVYAGLGFFDAYSYHYRAREPEPS